MGGDQIVKKKDPIPHLFYDLSLVIGFIVWMRAFCLQNQSFATLPTSGPVWGPLSVKRNGLLAGGLSEVCFYGMMPKIS